MRHYPFTETRKEWFINNHALSNAISTSFVIIVTVDGSQVHRVHINLHTTFLLSRLLQHVFGLQILFFFPEEQQV